MKKRKWIVGLSITLTVTVLIDQTFQYTALADGFFAGRRVAPYDPPIFFDQQQVWYDRLVTHLETGQPAARFFKLDPDLGWCPPPDSGRDDMNYDWSGSRLGFTELPRTKTEGVTRVVAVGCSFTRGDEVGDTESWVSNPPPGSLISGEIPAFPCPHMNPGKSLRPMPVPHPFLTGLTPCWSSISTSGPTGGSVSAMPPRT